MTAGRVLTLVALVGCANLAPLQQDHTSLVAEIAQAEANQWALTCAPRELALAHAHREFAELEFQQGDARRASEHVALARENIALALKKAAECEPEDRDQDGLADDKDQCPDEAEDVDGFQDGDGCPDLDRDLDGITDALDGCPNDPEDPDGYLDEDGCPDLDNDLDGIVDANDACPDQAEDKDGDRDDDGCPEQPGDSDGDGVADDTDQCPGEAEDLDGVADLDGCPEPDDRDGDGILDADDGCPDQAEVRNQYLDEDGCPDEAPQKVKITREQIEITEQIKFAVAKDTILPESFGILNAVAQVLKDYPAIEIRIEGHTDSDGSDAYNLTLSQSRADAVMAYLRAQGIDASRLTAEGFGETRPIDTNRTSTGKANNRRVEFHITKGM